jgi:hypothetical protein
MDLEETINDNKQAKPGEKQETISEKTDADDALEISESIRKLALIAIDLIRELNKAA